MRKIWLLMVLAAFFAANTEAANRATAQLSQYDDEWIATVSGSTDINDSFSMDAEVDTTGYLQLGGSYDKVIDRYYINLYVTYGRAEIIDVYDVGVLGAMAVTPNLTVFLNTAHEWRKTKGYPILELKIFDQREWVSALGVFYKFFKAAEVGYILNHNRLLSGNRGINEVENDNINSHTISLSYKLKWVEPFVTYTNGQHRVRPGEPITRDDSTEIGVKARF